jgi:hypothetical protein
MEPKDMDVYKPNPATSHHGRKTAPVPISGDSDCFSNIMTGISCGMREAFDAVTDGLGPPTKTEYTVREVSILTGLSKKEIRSLMNRGKILARRDPGLGHALFVSREEVRRLMPDGDNEGDQPEPNETPTANLNNNIKKYTK